MDVKYYRFKIIREIRRVDGQDKMDGQDKQKAKINRKLKQIGNYLGRELD